MVVGTSRDADVLLPSGGDLNDAAGAGDLARYKVRGRWLFATSNLALGQVISEAEQACASCLEDWLLGTNPFLSNAAARRADHIEITRSAMPVLIQELCLRGQLHGLGIMNREYQPFLAFFRKDDRDEILRQLSVARDLVTRREIVGWRDLPSPEVARPGKAWRLLILAHAEYLGLGWVRDRRELVSW